MAYIPNPNQSVSGTVGASIIGLPPFKLGESTNASVITVGTAAANQSVSGTIGASVLGHAPVVIVGGSILTSSTANQSVSGAVGIEGTPTFLQLAGSILATSATVTPAANQSVSGTVGASIIGLTPVSVTFPTTQNVSGSVVAFQGTTEWTVKSSLAGGIFPVSGSVSAVITNANLNVSGSVAAWLQSTNASVITVGTAAPNQSVSGTVGASIIGTIPTTQTGTWISSVVSTVPSSVIVGASAFGTFPVTQATAEWTVKSSLAGGIFPVSGSVAATITNTNINVSGSVVAFQGAGWSGSVAAVQAGTQITSLVSTVPSSVIVGASAFGLTPVNLTTASASVITLIQGSVAAVRTGQIGTVITSISGIPQASIHGAVTFLPASVVSGHGSVNGAASVQLLAAPGTGLYNYLTDFTLSNTGAATTLVTFTDGDASIIGRSIAPTGGGAIATSLATPMKALKVNGVVNMVAATATSVLYGWAGGYKAP